MGTVGDTFGSVAFLVGPSVALLMLVVLMVLLRWTFSRGRSVVTPSREEYLVEAASFTTAIEAEYFSCVVSGAGIDTALKQADGRQTLLVPESQRDAAQDLLRRYAL